MHDQKTERPSGSSLSALFSSLSLRLFILLFVVIAVAFAAYAVVSIRRMSRDSQQNVYVCAERFSDMIQRSTHYSMLLNRKEDVHEIIGAIAEQQGVEGVRIYDKQGVIIYSANNEEIGKRVDLRAEACVSCHGSETPLESLDIANRTRVFEREAGYRVLGLINPIENAPECYNAACHAHSPDKSILGVLDVTMSLAANDQRLSVARRQATVAAIVMALIAGLLSAAFIYRMVRQPVHELIGSAVRVAAGDLETEIDIQDQSEVGQLATAFNQMTRDLKDARQELTEWSNRLEVKLKEKTEELSRSQQQVAHMDKMASLGKLAATVAHELNNPLAGILNYAKLAGRTIQESNASIPEREELYQHLRFIQKEANRSGGIVKNLLIFARPSGVELALHSLNEILDRSAMLIGHHMEIAEIELDMDKIKGDDQLVCDADQLEQAIVALLVNAVEAMPDGGTLTVKAEGKEESIRLTIADTGVGIPEEAVLRIFEPFYSSKEETNGAGLGLAVTYGIVQRHRGTIQVESEIGHGTTFQIELPRRPYKEERQDESE